MKTAIVTGASSGIGRATARRLAREGYALLLIGRNDRALGDVVQELAKQGGRVAAMAADVTQTEAPAAIMARMTQELGGLDALVNAAGIIATGGVEETTDEGWDAMMAVNVRAPFRLLREAAKSLIARRGAVVNVSSVNGLRAFAGVAAYCVSKAAVDHLTRCAALEFAPKGVRVNAVNPGVTVTNLHRRGGMDETRYAEFLDRAKTTHPLGRPGTADEIADLIAFLISPASGWITGETIAIDGGRHLTCLR